MFPFVLCDIAYHLLGDFDDLRFVHRRLLSRLHLLLHDSLHNLFNRHEHLAYYLNRHTNFLRDKHLDVHDPFNFLSDKSIFLCIISEVSA